jgi:glycosyltransferase involved in cell wall biosynthesis
MRYDFSVVIPFYNKTFELNLVLKGLTEQDYDRNKFEVVIVDDGSENRIDDLLKKYSNILNIKYIYLDHTANRGRNRNVGVKESQGERIILLDSDIIPVNNLISAFDDATRNKPKQVSVGFRSLMSNVDRQLLTEAVVENNCEILRRFPASSDSRYMTVNYEKSTGNKMEGKWQLLYTNCVCIPKKEFEAVGGFDEIFSKNWGAEDVELGFRLYQNGCNIEMNEDAHGFHIFHPENWVERTASLRKNYDIFLQMHQHWSIELFIREYETLAIEMIEIQNIMKTRNYIITEIQNLDRVINELPEQVLICGIENDQLLKSNKIEKAFLPESQFQQPKIIHWIGIKTVYSNQHFKLALLSKKYETVNYGLFRMLYEEIQRIAEKVILVDENTDVLAQLSATQPVHHHFPKQIIFLVSPGVNYSIYKHFIQLAVALHKKGIKTGYNVFFDPFHETNPNQGIMRTINPEKIQIIQKLLKHELDFIGDFIPAMIDQTILKETTKCMGPRILWEEIHYHHQEKEVITELVPLVDAICPRRSADQRFYPEEKLMGYFPAGIDKQKINEIQAKPKSPNRKFTITWSDQYTNSYSHLGLILETFSELFQDQEDIELRIIHTGNNIIYTAYNQFCRQNSYDENYQRLFHQYNTHENIQFIQAELSDEEYSREIDQCDCFINLNSQMKINSWVLESVAFGKKPIILANQNYDGYFSEQECFKVSTYTEPVFSGKPSSNNIGSAADSMKSYFIDMPEKKSLQETLLKIYQNKDSVFIDSNIAADFKDRHDWMVIAEKFAEIL